VSGFMPESIRPKLQSDAGPSTAVASVGEQHDHVSVLMPTDA
jgi:hypothetical protein